MKGIQLGYGPTGSGTVVPPPSLLILMYSLPSTVDCRVRSCEVWYCGALSLPLDGGVEGTVLLGLVLLRPSLPVGTAVLSVSTVEGRAWSYGVWYCCASSFPLIRSYSLV